MFNKIEKITFFSFNIYINKKLKYKIWQFKLENTKGTVSS